ncbi:MAG: hypothetical protein WA154_11190 [Moraxellaceae bacterium]
MKVADYLERPYPQPPCWYLVMDVLREQCGFAAADHTPEADGKIAIAHAFRVALHEGGLKGFRKVAAPADFTVVFMARRPGGTPLHCGVWYQGKVLHAMRRMVVWEPLFSLGDRYAHFEYWMHDGHH